jgi:hypothetical protein
MDYKPSYSTEKCVSCRKSLRKIHWYEHIMLRCDNARCSRFLSPARQTLPNPYRAFENGVTV